MQLLEVKNFNTMFLLVPGEHNWGAQRMVKVALDDANRIQLIRYDSSEMGLQFQS